jgi:preprotein translocase subunit SecA
MFFKHADARLQKLAEEWKSHQASVREEEVEGQDGSLKDKKMGRNDPCPCGSGLKYKKCCGGSG